MNKTVTVLFVCLGNICRSPAAEGIFKSTICNESLLNFEVDSAGTSGYHAGELADARMRLAAKNRGLELESRSRKFTKEDFSRFDYIIVMDQSNMDNVLDLDQSGEFGGKVFLMTDFATEQFKEFDHVPDPYYGGEQGFDLVLDLLENSCENFYQFIKEKECP